MVERDHNQVMSHNFKGDVSVEVGDEHKLSLRSRQPNGTVPGEPLVRRSWRPCQMMNQDGELNPHYRHHHHHHHHHHQPHQNSHPQEGRGPPRHRRRPHSGQVQGQSQPQGPGLVPTVAPSRLDISENQETDQRPVHQPRLAITRYRRQGDPNPRLRGQRRRQQFVEKRDSCPGAKGRSDPAEVQAQQQSSGDPVTDLSQDRESPYQAPVAVVTNTHVFPDATTCNFSPNPQHSTCAEAEEDLQQSKMGCYKELGEHKENDEELKQEEDNGGCHSTTGLSSCINGDMQTVDDKAEEGEKREEVGKEGVIDDLVEDIAAQGSEVTDICSDTESAASLSMDGPLHSPPPLHSPTPPSSPDVPPFPQLDHFSEDTSLSPLPDNDLLPGEEEDNEDCSESYLASHSTSCSESYPKTYADFYSESHRKTHPEPVLESHSEPKSHPCSFPEPLKTSYPELHRDPCRKPAWTTEPNEAKQVPSQEPFTSNRHENVQKGTPYSPTEGSHYTPRQETDRGSLHSPVDRSVGSRLHHYDGKSDGEDDSDDQSPVPQSRKHACGKAETQARNPTSGQSGLVEAQEEQNPMGHQGEEGLRGSGDAITLAIKDIKNAIEEVKTKTVRSPYRPDKPVEPIWVMRQEVSPTEDVCSPQTSGGHVSMTHLCQPIKILFYSIV